MNPEFKVKLSHEIKKNVVRILRENMELFCEFIDKMESSDDIEPFLDMATMIDTEANEKAGSPFQRFLVGYIVTHSSALRMGEDFFKSRNEWEKQEMLKQENIDKLKDFFHKRADELIQKMGQS